MVAQTKRVARKPPLASALATPRLLFGLKGLAPIGYCRREVRWGSAAKCAAGYTLARPSRSKTAAPLNH
jgi:hypothetical protein